MYFEIYEERTKPTVRDPLAGMQLSTVGQWRWRLKAGNHELIAQGAFYATKQTCEHAISLLQATTLQTPVRYVSASHNG